MINETDKNQYKSIKAPKELKQRILCDSENIVPQKKTNTRKYIQLVAACLVAVFCIGFVGVGLTSSTVYVNDKAFYGEKITLKNEPALAMHRAHSQESQRIEIDAKIETDVSISYGEFTLLDSQTGEEIYTGNEYSVKGRVVVMVNTPLGEKSVLKLQNLLSEREIVFETNGF